MHTFNPSTSEAEAGGSVSLRPVWSIERVPGQPGLHRAWRNLVSKEKKRKEKRGVKAVSFFFYIQVI